MFWPIYYYQMIKKLEASILPPMKILEFDNRRNPKQKYATAQLVYYRIKSNPKFCKATVGIEACRKHLKLDNILLL